MNQDPKKVFDVEYDKIADIANSYHRKDSLLVQLLSSTRSREIDNVEFSDIGEIDFNVIKEHIEFDIEDREYPCEDSIRCGPEATEWLKVEILLWMNFAWNLNRLAISWGKAKNKRRPWYEFWVPKRIDIKSFQYAIMLIIGPQLTYSPTTTFSSASGLCPISCPNTLTVCGGCIDRSEIGNFIYGVLARYMQMTWLQTWGGSVFGNRGKRTNSDAAAVELGWDFIDQGNTNTNNLCAFFATNAGLWKKMQEDGNWCPICTQSVVPANSSHTTFPPIGSITANTRITVTLPTNVVGQP